jgi:hypothetical protein
MASPSLSRVVDASGAPEGAGKRTSKELITEASMVSIIFIQA